MIFCDLCLSVISFVCIIIDLKHFQATEIYFLFSEMKQSATYQKPFFSFQFDFLIEIIKQFQNYFRSSVILVAQC